MARYKYRAINNKGRPVRGVITAINEVDLHNQLQSGGLELVQCQAIDKKKGLKGAQDDTPVAIPAGNIWGLWNSRATFAKARTIEQD